MPDSTMAQIITAIASVITAVGGLGVLIPLLKTARSTHRIVNQEKTDRDNFNRALIRALEERGIAVPIDQSLPVPTATTDR